MSTSRNHTRPHGAPSDYPTAPPHSSTDPYNRRRNQGPSSSALRAAAESLTRRGGKGSSPDVSFNGGRGRKASPAGSIRSNPSSIDSEALRRAAACVARSMYGGRSRESDARSAQVGETYNAARDLVVEGDGDTSRLGSWLSDIPGAFPGTNEDAKDRRGEWNIQIGGPVVGKTAAAWSEEAQKTTRAPPAGPQGSGAPDPEQQAQVFDHLTVNKKINTMASSTASLEGASLDSVSPDQKQRKLTSSSFFDGDEYGNARDAEDEARRVTSELRRKKDAGSSSAVRPNNKTPGNPARKVAPGQKNNDARSFPTSRPIDTNSGSSNRTHAEQGARPYPGNKDAGAGGLPVKSGSSASRIASSSRAVPSTGLFDDDVIGVVSGGQRSGIPASSTVTPPDFRSHSQQSPALQQKPDVLDGDDAEMRVQKAKRHYDGATAVVPLSPQRPGHGDKDRVIHASRPKVQSNRSGHGDDSEQATSRMKSAAGPDAHTPRSPSLLDSPSRSFFDHDRDNSANIVDSASIPIGGSPIEQLSVASIVSSSRPAVFEGEGDDAGQKSSSRRTSVFALPKFGTANRSDGVVGSLRRRWSIVEMPLRRASAADTPDGAAQGGSRRQQQQSQREAGKLPYGLDYSFPADDDDAQAPSAGERRQVATTAMSSAASMNGRRRTHVRFALDHSAGAASAATSPNANNSDPEVEELANHDGQATGLAAARSDNSSPNDTKARRPRALWLASCLLPIILLLSPFILGFALSTSAVLSTPSATPSKGLSIDQLLRYILHMSHGFDSGIANFDRAAFAPCIAVWMGVQVLAGTGRRVHDGREEVLRRFDTVAVDAPAQTNWSYPCLRSAASVEQKTSALAVLAADQAEIWALGDEGIWPAARVFLEIQGLVGGLEPVLLTLGATASQQSEFVRKLLVPEEATAISLASPSFWAPISRFWYMGVWQPTLAIHEADDDSSDLFPLWLRGMRSFITGPAWKRVWLRYIFYGVWEPFPVALRRHHSVMASALLNATTEVSSLLRGIQNLGVPCSDRLRAFQTKLALAIDSSTSRRLLRNMTHNDLEPVCKWARSQSLPSKDDADYSHLLKAVNALHQLEKTLQAIVDSSRRLESGNTGWLSLSGISDVPGVEHSGRKMLGRGLREVDGWVERWGMLDG